MVKIIIITVELYVHLIYFQKYFDNFLSVLGLGKNISLIFMQFKKNFAIMNFLNIRQHWYLGYAFNLTFIIILILLFF